MVNAESLVERDPRVGARPCRRVDRIAERTVDDSVIVYDMQYQRAHVLNPTAAIVWELCTGDHAVEDIAEHLVASYPVDRLVVEQDVNEIITAFANEHLLQT